MSNKTAPHGPGKHYTLIVDSTFIAIPQPDDSTKCKAYCHAKSPTNCALKVQIDSDFRYRIVYVSECYKTLQKNRRRVINSSKGFISVIGAFIYRLCRKPSHIPFF